VTERCDIVIRADATGEIGSGHVMRMLAFAQLLQDAGKSVCFVSYIESPVLTEKIRQSGFGYEPMEQRMLNDLTVDANKLLTVAKQRQAQWVVTDGYPFVTEYQQAVKDAGYCLMCVDDIAACHYVADIVLNQNVHAVKKMYSCEPETKLFLGPQHALIRRPFLEAAQNFTRQFPQTAKNILVTKGGADPNNITLMTLRGLAQMESVDVSIRVVLGPLNRHVRAIEEYCTKSHVPIEVLRDQNDQQMVELMQWADLAVTSGGSVLWEFGLFAVPLLGVIIAENQRALMEALDAGGALCSLGWHEDVDEQMICDQAEVLVKDAGLRRQYSQRIMETVSQRRDADLLDCLMSDPDNSAAISLRAATPDDCQQLFDWVNEPTVRRNSIQQDPVEWKSHQQWFKRRLADRDGTRIFIGDNGQGAVGQIRFDRQGDKVQIDISVDAQARGRGMGRVLLEEGKRRIVKDWPDIKELIGMVKEENIASQRIFEQCGFVLADQSELRTYLFKLD